VWVPEGSLVRAGSPGFLSTARVRSGSTVQKGQVLIECTDPLLVAEERVLDARVRALKARYDAESYSDRVKAAITRDELLAAQANLTRAVERSRELTIKSPTDGTFILPGEDDLPGRYVNKGDLLAYVIEYDTPTVRTVVYQSDVDLIRRHNEGVLVRMAEDLDRIYEASVLREVPGAEARLPSNALGLAGGGDVAVAPWDQQGLETIENLFHLELKLPPQAGRAKVGAEPTSGSTTDAPPWPASGTGACGSCS